MIELIDAHAHLNEIEALDADLAEARRAGVGQVVAMGMEMASNEQNLRLAAQYAGQVWPALGYHPWSLEAEKVTATLDQIREYLPRCVALGEVGLDYKVRVPKKLQQEVFATPVSYQGRPSRPVDLLQTLEHLSRIKQIPMEEAALATAANARRFYDLPQS